MSSGSTGILLGSLKQGDKLFRKLNYQALASSFTSLQADVHLPASVLPLHTLVK